MRQEQLFDLVIVGGGINGVGIARDAAGRGLSVALLEQNDLANATSSASSKLIHGGLRYLENYEFRLVREALSERETLLSIAPHIVWPLRFILPHVPQLRARWLLRLGLFFYDHAGGRRRLPASQSVRLTPGDPLRADLRHGFAYSDCWVDDARLVVLNAMDAAARGAKILTRTRYVGAAAQGGFWHVRGQDSVNGASVELRARVVVNAAGPWVGDVLGGMSGVPPEGARTRLIKGSHIVVPRLYTGDHAYTLQQQDGRVVFVIPYEHDFSLIGTTDVPFGGDATAARISPEEAQYLINAVNDFLAGRTLTANDVVWSYAGVRPLFDDAAANASKVTRDYRLDLVQEPGGAPVLSVLGGKITTYRRLAEAAMAKLSPLLGGTRTSWTGDAALPGGDLPLKGIDALRDECRQRWPWLQEATLLRLTRSYGTRIERVVGNASGLADMGHSYGAGLTAAEIDYLRREEWAATADDVLWRRSKLGLHMTAPQRSAVADVFDAARSPGSV